MITLVQNLQGTCKHCSRRADWSVTMTNDDLPEEYFREGERIEHYCDTHLPDDARALMDNISKAARTPPLRRVR